MQKKSDHSNRLKMQQSGTGTSASGHTRFPRPPKKTPLAISSSFPRELTLRAHYQLAINAIGRPVMAILAIYEHYQLATEREAIGGLIVAILRIYEHYKIHKIRD